MPTIFTFVRGNEPDMKILLLFLENDKDVTKWLKIKEKYMKYKLRGTEGSLSKKMEVK